MQRMLHSVFHRYKAIILCVLSLFFICIGVYGQDGRSWWNENQLVTEGTEFYVTFMRNWGKAVGDNDLVLTLYATAHEKTTVTVEGIYTDSGDKTGGSAWSDSFEVPADGVGSIIIPHQVAYLEGPDMRTNLEWLNKGIHVTSSNNVPIVLYASNTDKKSYDAIIVYPVNATNKEYVILTYPTDEQATEFAIVSSENNNSVEIKIHETYFDLDSNKIAGTKDVKFNITLQQGQTYLYKANDGVTSLAGSTICAAKPITLLQGGQFASIPMGMEPSSHIYNHAVSTDQWGQKYIVTRTAQQDVDFVVFLASEDGTSIYRNSSTIPIATIDKGQSCYDTIQWKDYQDDAIYYHSSNATECVIFQTGKDNNPNTNVGSPTMTDITPLEHSISRIIFAGFNYRYSTTKVYSINNHYVNIVLPTIYKDSMVVDNTPIQSTKFRELPLLIDGVQYSYCCYSISEGSHMLRNSQGGFIAHVYGQNALNNIGQITYSYSAGRNILHPMWMLINGERTDSASVCEDEMPVTFTSVINFDYDSVWWEHHYLSGTSQTVQKSKTAQGDSVVNYYYKDIPRGRPIIDHIDTVYMIVARHTPICDYLIQDTVRAIVQVNDTFNIHENEENGLSPNVCYGDSFQLHYHGKTQTYIADTTTVQYFDNRQIKFVLNEPLHFYDDDTTVYGCDSLIEQVRIMRPTFDTLIYDTVCYKSLPYEWRRDDNGQLIQILTKDSLYNKHNLHLTQARTFKADSIISQVTLKTLYGCDSVVRINVLVLPDYEFHEQKEPCRDSISPIFTQWYGHQYTNGTALPGHYFQQWLSGRWKDVTYISVKESGSFLYRDSIKTKRIRCNQCEDNVGCDSIFYLHLNVQPHYKKEFDSTVCDNGYVYWEDTLRIGKNCPIPEDNRLWKRYTKASNTITVLHPSSEIGECDSTFVLHLHFCSTYHTTEEVHICENQSYRFQPSPKDSSHDKIFNQNGEWACKTDQYGNKIVGEYELKDTVKTIRKCNPFGGCDSVVTHIVYVHPTYRVTKYDTTCQVYGGTYVWLGHTDRPLWDSINKKRIAGDKIPQSVAGDFVYVDSTHCTTCDSCLYGNCDSIITLRLKVYPTYYIEDSSTICEGDSVLWEGEYRKGKQVQRTTEEGSEQYGKTKYINEDYTKLLKALGGCDSVRVLHLLVKERGWDTMTVTGCDRIEVFEFEDLTWGPYVAVNKDTVYEEIRQTNPVDGCEKYAKVVAKVGKSWRNLTDKDTIISDKQPFVWRGNDYGTLSVGTHTFDTTYKTVNYGCDSVYTIHVTVQRSYFHPESEHLCENDSYQWTNHKNDIVYSGLKSRTEPYVFYDSLKTKITQQDSIFELRLFVHPVYRKDSVVAICASDMPYLYKAGNTEEWIALRKSKDEADTIVRDTTLKTIHGCDSTIHFELHIFPVYEREMRDTVCEQDPSWNWEVYSIDGTEHYTVPFSRRDLHGNPIIDTPLVYRFETHSVDTLHCDSVVTLYRTVLPILRDTQTMTICSSALPHQYPDGALFDKVGNDEHEYTTKSIQYGCDSIVQFYLTVLDSIVLPTERTICSGDSVYWDNDWFKGNPVPQTDTLLRRLYGETMWRDTVIRHPYQTVKNGCDSVLWLRLTVNPIEHIHEEIILCDNEEYVLSDSTINARRAGRYHDVRVRKRSKADECDVVYSADVTILPTYHFVAYDTICQDTVNPIYTYDKEQLMWMDPVHPDVRPNHSMKVNIGRVFTGSAPVADSVYYDSLKTITCTECKNGGCDSIYELHLTVLRSYEFSEQYLMSDEDVYEWHGKIYGGEKATEPYDSLVTKDTYIVRSYPTQKTGTYECDSVYKIRLFLGEVHRINEYDTICENESVYHWKRDEQNIRDIPSADFPEVGKTKEYTDSHKTVLGFDSVYTLHLYRARAYQFDTVYANTCRYGTYTWEEHNFPLYNKEMERWVNEFKTDEVGDFVYIDSLTTDIYGCDSVHVLKLIVRPVSTSTQDSAACQSAGGYFTWKEHEGHKLALIGGDSTNLIPLSAAGDYVYIDHQYTEDFGCDILDTLRLHIHPTYTTVAAKDTDVFYICENKTYHFHTANEDTVYNTDGSWKMEDTIPVFYDISGIDTTINGCDSAVLHRVWIYPTYEKQDSLRICAKSEPYYTWIGHRKSDPTAQTDWLWDKQQRKRIGKDEIPCDVSGYYEYVDSLKTLTCQGCVEGGCDSIWVLRLFVDSVYYYDTVRTMSNEDTLRWQHHLFVGNHYPKMVEKREGDTIIYLSDDQIWHDFDTTYHTIHHCDSIYHLRIVLGKIFRDTIVRYICENDSFTWYHEGETTVPEERIGLKEEKEYFDSLKTAVIYVNGNPIQYDSIYVLDLRHNPTYHKDTTDSVCQVQGGIYKGWAGHSDNLYFVEGLRWIRQNEISLSDSGWFHYVDSLKTLSYLLGEGQEAESGSNTGCDSIWTLNLYVKPQYYLYDTLVMPADSIMKWYDRMYQGVGYGWGYEIIPDGDENHQDSVYYAYDSRYQCIYCESEDYKNSYLMRDTVFFDTIGGTTVLGCDSIHYLRLEIPHAGETIVDVNACDNDSLYVYEAYKDTIRFEPHYSYPELTHKDTLFFNREYRHATVDGHDSIVHLHLTVHPTYLFTQSASTCWETPYEWRGKTYNKTQTYYDTVKTVSGCDSVYALNLYVPPVDIDTIYRRICSNQSFVIDDTIRYAHDPTRYDIYHDTLWHANSQGSTVIRVRHTKGPTGCDSIVRYYVLTVCPTYINGHNTQDVLPSDRDTLHICSSDSIELYPGHWVGLDTIYDVGERILPVDTTFSEHFSTNNKIELGVLDPIIFSDYCQCDSDYMKHAIIYPQYRHFDTMRMCESDTLEWQGILYVGREFMNYHADAVIDSSRYRRIEVVSYSDYVEGIKRDAEYYQSEYGCDSVYHLSLRISQVYRTTTERRVCQTDTGYYYQYLNNGVGGMLPALHLSDSLVRIDTMKTIDGCDSIVTLRYHVDSVYRYEQRATECQLPGGEYIWVNGFGDTLNNHIEPISDRHISLSVGDTTIYREVHYTSRQDCDSTFRLELYVAPMYQYDSITAICTNERIVWQDRVYDGENLPIGTHYDTVRNKTFLGCDSVFTLTLKVNPVYDTTEHITICDNDMPFVWYQEDKNGKYDTLIWSPKTFRDTIRLTPYQSNFPWKQKADTVYEAHRMLQTLNGCDSMTHLRLTIKPTYLFLSDTSVCENDRVYWRGRDYNNNLPYGIYEYRETVSGECDSIYLLRVTVSPTYHFFKSDTLCDNETLYHNPDSVEAVRRAIWTPNMRENGYVDSVQIRFRSREGCDSIYHYYLTIRRTYDSLRYVATCSNAWEELHEQKVVSLDTLYPVTGIQREPVDTLFVDSLQTIYGCDSIFRLQALVYPAYRHIDYDTICSNDTACWRNHRCYRALNVAPDAAADPYTQAFSFIHAGDTVYQDRYTTDFGCDSIYELRLHIKPAYDYPLDVTLCYDDLPFQDGKIIVQTKDITRHDVTNHLWRYENTYHFFTTEDCDSIIHLNLTVYDTTSTILVDTICEGDRYYPISIDHDPLIARNDSTVYHTTSGIYIDVTTNIYGCRHTVHTRLAVIPPTTYSLQFSPICADEDTVWIHYTYHGRYIDSYSILFDSLGHTQGFQDIHHEPITHPSEHTIAIPIPHGDTLTRPTPPYFDTWSGLPHYSSEYKHNYPRPYDYPLTIIMHNGYCDDRRQSRDTMLHIHYPSWIHEQHWNDGIVLYNDIYNGGYEFTHYQWYYNDRPIPGQVREFLYLPDSLHLNWGKDIQGNHCRNEYKVQLTRKDDGYTTFTCPICPVLINDHIVPQKDYFAIVPTLVVASHPVVWILSTQPGNYWVYSAGYGTLYQTGSFVPDDNNYGGTITLPTTIDGEMIVKLCTKDGECRSFPILIIHGK